MKAVQQKKKKQTSETMRRCKNLITAERNSSYPLVVSCVTMNKYEILYRPPGTNAIARPQMYEADYVRLHSNENGSEMTRNDKAKLIGIQRNWLIAHRMLHHR